MRSSSLTGSLRSERTGGLMTTLGSAYRERWCCLRASRAAAALAFSGSGHGQV